MNIYELTARFDSRKSFYHKALVQVENGIHTLLSYETPVAKIENGKLTLLSAWDYSATTKRHVKEFVIQHGVQEQFNELISGTKRAV